MKEYVINNRLTRIDGRKTLFKANEKGILTPKIQYSLNTEIKEQPEDLQYYLLKWEDIEKIEFGKYNGCNEYMCFYTTDGFVYILHMNMFFQFFSFSKLYKKFKNLSGNNSLNMTIVNEEVCPNYFPEEPVKKEDFLMLKRQHANDNYSPENQQDDIDGLETDKKFKFSLYPKNYKIKIQNEIPSVIKLWIIILISLFCIHFSEYFWGIQIIMCTLCIVYCIYDFIKREKNKILLFKASRQGVFFYNVHEYSATLKWNNIKKVTFGKLENKFLYICFQTNDDILYFYKHPKREVLWFLKGLFRHYSGNKNLEITTIKNDYFYIPVRKPISKQEYLDEVKKLKNVINK